MTSKTITDSPAASLAWATKLGRLLKGGEFIELSGDLGSGKTLLVQGLAAGLGYEGEIVSPTFTLNRIYELPGSKKLYHFDFYRLKSGDPIAHELAETSADSNAIVAVEWPATIAAALPEQRLRITLTVLDPDRRQIVLQSLGGKFDYAVEALK